MLGGRWQKCGDDGRGAAAVGGSGDRRMVAGIMRW